MMFSSSSISKETESLKNDAQFSKFHDQAILEYFGRSVKLTEIPLLGVITAITIVLYIDFQSTVIFIWLIQALLCQIPRLYLAFRITGKSSEPTKDLIYKARLLALISGLSMASIAFLAPDMSVETRALISMILIGTAAASIATCLGYKPIYYNGSIPIFITIILIWTLDYSDQVENPFQVLVVLLTLQLGAVFYGLIGQVYSSFLQNLYSQQRLKYTVAAEKSANAAKTRFLAAASHDLRQPLHVMSLYSSALINRPLDPESKTIAVKMNEAMNILADELDSLLDISKLDAEVIPVNSELFNLSRLVERTVDSIQPMAANKNIDLNRKIPPDIWVHSDANLLGRMFRNVLENAIKYTHEGHVDCILSTQGNSVVIKIKDTGIGITKEEQGHIWEEFYQVKNNSRDRKLGLGLGLSVVKRLALLLDADVRLASSSSSGSCFEIALPQYISEMTTPTASTENHLTPDLAYLKGRSILIVDDDEGIQLSTQTLLADIGMNAQVAGGTSEALSIVNTSDIECVLMDLRLADGDDGFDAIDKIRMIDPAIPIIIVSGDTAPDRLIRANRRECVWLVKPIKFNLLIAEFENIFR